MVNASTNRRNCGEEDLRTIVVERGDRPHTAKDHSRVQKGIDEPRCAVRTVSVRIGRVRSAGSGFFKFDQRQAFDVVGPSEPNQPSVQQVAARRDLTPDTLVVVKPTPTGVGVWRADQRCGSQREEQRVKNKRSMRHASCRTQRRPSSTRTRTMISTAPMTPTPPWP